MEPFVDRKEAGLGLADRLVSLGLTRPVVLGIPRGGIVVAYEIAVRLGAPLDVLLVRKVGAPADPEYGLGAVAEGGIRLLDEPRARAAGYRVEDLEPTIRAEERELERRRVRYRGDRPRIELKDRDVVIADDGVATGGTFVAGARAVRALGARRVVGALGVCPPSSVERLAGEVDDLVVLLTPPQFEAVGQWFREFDPVEDEEVVALLRAASSQPPGPAERSDPRATAPS